MTMRLLPLIPFVLLTACSTEVTPPTCGPVFMLVHTGWHQDLKRDVCGVGLRIGDPADERDSYIAWSDSAPALFSIPDVPWYLSFEFLRIDARGDLPYVLRVYADEHAPRGRFAGKYEYRLESRPFQVGGVIIDVEFGGEERVNFNATVMGEGVVRDGLVNCGQGSDRCARSFASGETISLEVVPADGFQFSHVEGCNLTQNSEGKLVATAMQDMSCRVVFTPANGDTMLAVDIAGDGGEVLVEFNQMVETLTHAQSFALEPGTLVTLTAVDVPPYEFQEWVGHCAGMGREAQVTLNEHKTCTAVFHHEVVGNDILNLTITGEGEVQIGSGAACGIETQCPQYYAAPGEVVPLTAMPRQGSVFVGWGGACAGTDPMTMVTVNGSVACSATFQ